jgi:hypothetical protein
VNKKEEQEEDEQKKRRRTRIRKLRIYMSLVDKRNMLASRDLCGIMTDVVSFKHHFYKLFSYQRDI